MKENACLIENKRFSVGDQVCEEKRCYVCKDGFWEERFVDRVFGTGTAIGP